MAVVGQGTLPKHIEADSSSAITRVPQPDGTIKYYQGNYARFGCIDNIVIVERGKYKKGVKPRVVLREENGDVIPDNAGAKFVLLMDSQNSVHTIKTAQGYEGTGFTPDRPVTVTLEVDDPKDAYIPFEGYAVAAGQFIEGMTESQCVALNAELQKNFENRLRTTNPKLNTPNAILGARDTSGQPTKTQSRTGLR